MLKSVLHFQRYLEHLLQRILNFSNRLSGRILQMVDLPQAFEKLWICVNLEYSIVQKIRYSPLKSEALCNQTGWGNTFCMMSKNFNRHKSCQKSLQRNRPLGPICLQAFPMRVANYWKFLTTCEMLSLCICNSLFGS